ncbi:MAG: FAD-dependent oxidoreductase [Peptococcaceae bacterium]|jgi:hypothetical protein|nr:FAD-dependent oxidoreductase [Peptococcaceae bacterium]MDH7525768.1 FAD-dependent oxidoreductase [Peptococcaceae bacterium]
MEKGKGLNTATRTVKREGTVPAQELTADICVAGAGIAGVSAALEAARLGRRVILFDCLPALGGQAVNSMIHMFCGLFSNGPNPYQFTHGIADDILRDLGRAGALHYRRGAWTTVMYDVVDLARWIEQEVARAGIVVVLGAVLRGAIVEGRRIQSLELATRYGDLKVIAAGFVDATGDAALAWHAGLPCREPVDGPIYGSHMMVLEGVEYQGLPNKDELSEVMRKKGKAYGLVRAVGQVFPFPPRGTVTVNLTHEETPLEPVAASLKTLEGKAQADRVFQFLKNEFPQNFGQARVRAYALPGIRQTRWIVGRYQLTADDVRSGRRFPDSIARTAWPIEIHDSLEGYYWEQFSEDHVHYVPFGSLTPPGIDNLVAAGRCLDGDVAAHSSVRVMGPCIAMGAAAAHALDLAGSGSVHDIALSELAERVKDNVERTD